jgi:PDZ domain-containing protein
VVPAAYVELSPGPTFNTIGSFEGTPLITISDRKTYPTTGNLDMVTVSERGGPFGGLYAGGVIRGWVDPTSEVLPQEALYPDAVSSAQVNQQNQVDFVDSQSNAVAAALGYLHIPVTSRVSVVVVSPGGPSDGKLEVGDVLLAVDGTRVKTLDGVTAQLATRKPREQVVVEVDRGGVNKTVMVTAGDSPSKPGKAFLGISMAQSAVGPFPIEFKLSDVGGPSAGMMFSLGIIDELTPDNLTGGHHIAGTGTIDPGGTVGAIGGIAQKMVGARDSGATIFLAPASNCGDVIGHIPEGLTVAAVVTLTDSVAALEALTHGRPAPKTCS